MRGFLILLVACGGAGATSTPVPPPQIAAPIRRIHATPIPHVPVDAIAALMQPRVEAGWIVPGPAQLVLGGTTLQADDDSPLEVDLLEERGSEVRVGVRLDHVRFALWIARSRLFGIVARDANVSVDPGTEFVGDGAPAVTLHAGARVHRLAHRNGYTQIRYIGSVEVDGWIPDDALGDRGAADHTTGRRFSGRRSLMVAPGATVRTDKRWAARALAVAHYSMVLETVEVLDEGWHKVSYGDTDVSVDGFLSKREAPSPTHASHQPEPALALATNGTVPADTCLYAGDEAIGFVVGDRPALVEASPRVGWFTLTFDTPWGAVAFEASGPNESALAKCPQP